jgi:hypothetical protein
MTVSIRSTPSGALLLYSSLTLRKLPQKIKRNVLLCQPSTPADIQFIHNQTTQLSSQVSKLQEKNVPESLDDDPPQPDLEQNQVKKQDIELYGHLSLSAISGTYASLGVTCRVPCFDNGLDVHPFLPNYELIG